MFASLLLAVTLVLTLVSCWTDVRALRIPNWLCLAIAVCFAAAYASLPAAFLPLWSHLGAGLLMLVVGFVLFWFHLYGAGDIKLAAVLSLWLGFQGLFLFVLVMAAAGGVLGAVALYIKAKKPFAQPSPQGWVGQLQAGRSAMPYGLAINAGFWATVFHTPHLADRLHEVINLIH